MYREGDRLVVSASDLVTELACPHFTALSLAASAQPKPQTTSGPKARQEMSVLQKRGFEHEADYAEKLRRQGLEVLDVSSADISANGLRAAEQATAKAMEAGTDVVFQGTFFDESGPVTWRGHADFLRNVAPAGEPPVYEPIDTKLAGHATPSAILQLCHYAEHLERLQGVAPERIHVELRGAGTATFDLAAFAAYERRAKARFEALVLAGAADTYPLPCDHCAVCRHKDACADQRVADDHLSLVAGLSRGQARKLDAVGITTMAALAGCDEGATVPGINDATVARLRRQAGLQRQHRLHPDDPMPVELLPFGELGHGLLALPEPSPGDLFFDIEGDPFVGDVGLEYLLGVGWVDGGTFAYECFWAHDATAEKASFEAFIDFVMARLDADPNLHIYHYAPYETTAVAKLMGRYGTREVEVDRLLRGGVFVDLYRVVRQSLLVGSPSYGLKKLEPLYMGPRNAAITDAGSSIDEYERWIDTHDQQILDDIEEYNLDDCESTLLLRDWLEGHRTDAIERGMSTERPGTTDGAASEAVAEAEAETDDLIARLRGTAEGTASRPATVDTNDDAVEAHDVSDDSDDDSSGGEELTVDAISPEASEADQTAKELLASLLGWHRREDKPVWWQYFHRVLDCTDRDLVDDTEAIGELTYEGVIDQEARSSIHRYVFDPDQEHKIAAGTTVRDPSTDRRALHDGEKASGPGTVVAVDGVAGTIDLKRATTSTVAHPTSLIPGGPITTTEQRNALVRFAADVADNGLEHDGPGQAGRDLLIGLGPTIEGIEPGASLRPDPSVPLLDTAKALALHLDRSCLPLQGPPGAGKTYTAARVIVALVADGRKVGITANSHAVISNLLGEVMKAAKEDGVDVSALQKASADDTTVAHPNVTLTGSNATVVQALADGTVDVVAGTAWLFARQEMDQLLDVLVVDEAGQLSLANTIAVSGCAENLILVGDPQQLAQPSKGVHPPGSERSALEHLLDGEATIPDDRGLFLDRTWRMHPEICSFISDLAYDGRLESTDDCTRQKIAKGPVVEGSGLRWVPVTHDGNRTSSPEEADAIAGIYDALLGRMWTNQHGTRSKLKAADILVVAPYNAQVHLLSERLPHGARVGTVDKFQGQEGAVVIVSMAASSADRVPRGMEFLYSPNRLNVAVSRARAMTVLVASPTLLTARCRTVHQLRLANNLCRYVEQATEVG